MDAPARTPSKNPGLQLYHDVLGLDDLHYGIWNGEDLTLDNLKAAQKRYTEYLLDWIGDEVKDVLDVGCGYGSISQALAERGFNAVGLTPDHDQKEAFERRTDLPCHLGKFQEFSPDRRFDLVLMSQSCHHVPLDKLFAVSQAVSPGGYLLVADYFLLKRDGTRGTRIGHLVDEFVAAAAAHEFRLLREADITEEVLPTLDFARDIVDNRVLPAIEIAHATALRKYPVLTRSLLWLLRSKISELSAKRRYVDRADFLEYKRYKRYLFQAPAAGG
ncbi:MAG: methyltransferase domain-containing protein [Alphaproteobacteria bacterium]|nr:methyltransferase domain-containing protein [Alphaproteobacteria bacterium]